MPYKNPEDRRAASRARYAKDPDKFKSAVYAWRAANPEAKKKWEAKNKTRILQAQRNRYAANPEKRKALSSKWREENPWYNSSYYLSNTRTILKQKKEWRNANKKYCRVQERKRKALKGAPGFTPAQFKERMASFENRCVYCNGPFEHVDHGTPLSRGGSHTLDNLFPSCASCNLHKARKTVAEFIP